MNRNPRLMLILATGSGAILMTYAALRYYFRRRQRKIEDDAAKAEKERQNSPKKDAPSAPELRLDPKEETTTKRDLAKAQIISSLVGDGSSSASFDDSDSLSEEHFVNGILDEDDEEEEEDEEATLEATGLEGDDDDGDEEDDGFEGSRIADDDVAERSSLDISLPDVPAEGAASILSPTEAEVLVDYLAGGSLRRRTQCLISIANAALFSANQYLLRRAGCIPVLNDLLMSEDHVTASQACKALTNLAVNEENQEHMDETVGILVTIIGKYHRATDPDQRRAHLDAELCAMQTLTNLSVTNKYHSLVAPLLPGLMENVDNCDTFGENSASILTQTWKILVNLSSNSSMLPSLLACDAPETFLEFLSDASKRSDSSNALRICYFMANIMDCLNKESLPFPFATAPPPPPPASAKSAGSPTPNACSQDSLYALLCQEEKSSELRTLLLDLTRHSDDNIRQQSTRLYTALFLFWGRKMSQSEGGRKSSPL